MMWEKLKCVCLLLSLMLILGGCASGKKYTQSELSDFLLISDVELLVERLEQEGQYCNRMFEYESDERLKRVTDGTLNEVRFYTCRREDSGPFCVTHRFLHIVSQYGIPLSVTDHPKTNRFCFWDVN